MMTDVTPTQDSAVTPPKVNPATGQPYPPMGVPVNADSADVESDNLDDIPGDRVYMNISWMNLPKELALEIRDVALAAAPDHLLSYSVSFSAPLDDV